MDESMSNDTRKVGEEAGRIPDPVVHNVDRVTDDLYFKEGSIRERLQSIEETLKHMPTKAYILGVILTVGVPAIIGIVAIIVRLFTHTSPS